MPRRIQARRRSAPPMSWKRPAQAVALRGFAWQSHRSRNSRPCSSVDRRVYTRSRSLLSVSIADASRRVSFWLSRATDWICWACRDRSAAAISSCRNRSEDWLASSATMMAPTEAAPQVPSRSIARRSRCSSSARKPLSTPPVFSVAKSAKWSFFFAIRVFGPPRGLPPNHAANINRKCAPGLNPGTYRGGLAGVAFGFPCAAKRFMTAAAMLQPCLS